MSRLPSTRLIEHPEISFAGRFKQDCAPPYSRSLWDDEQDEDDWTLEIACMPGQVFSFHGEELLAPDFSTLEERLTFVLRRICHLLVDRIDGRGLQEVCQSLAEFYEYYKPDESNNRLLTDIQTRDATVASRTTSAPFIIGEE